MLRYFVGYIEEDAKITLRSDATGSCVVSRDVICSSCWGSGFDALGS